MIDHFSHECANLKKPPNLFHALSLEQVLQTIPSGLFLVDRDQHIVYWNAEAERITGYTREEAIGRHCSFLEGIECGVRCGLFSEEIPKPITGALCTIRKKDGKQACISKNVDYLRNGEGSIIGGVESFVDVTRQKRLEERLRRHAQKLEKAVKKRTAELEAEQSRLRTVLDSMTDLAYITSPDYRVEFMNRAMTEVVGGHVGDLCHEIQGQDGICPWCPLPQVLAGETVKEERSFGGGGRVYEIMHTPLRNADGTVHKLSVYRDVTDRKKAEESLREANRDLDAFVYTVSHDLRTPLTPILGYAEFLREHYGDSLDERGLQILDEIEHQAERMLALMEDLLALARVGSVETPEKPPDTGRIIREVLHELESGPEISAGAVSVQPLPPLLMPESLISQVFGNLIGNALRYAGEGGAIEVGGMREGEVLRFFVRDHGPGIPQEEREKIFELFYRGSTAEKTRGTGIGLATVRKIVRLYGGRVWVEETPGGGSTFRVEFPVLP
jgi:PAS domain S-box-containing protein